MKTNPLSDSACSPAIHARSTGGHIVIFGAGSLGAFIAGSLIAALADVSLIGRAAMRARIERHGLCMSGRSGWEARVPAGMVRYAETPKALSTADLVVLTVKSVDIEEAARQIFRLAPARAVVLRLQNGIEDPAALRDSLPKRVVLAGLVSFQVAQLADGGLHRDDTGGIVVEEHPAWASWTPAFRSAGVPLRPSPDFREIQWGRLILELNQAVNALCGRPLGTQLLDCRYRWVLATVVDEALAALEVAGIRPAQTSDLEPTQLPDLLRLDDDDFMRNCGSLASIGPRARSPMWEELEAGRLTEVDSLNGSVVRLARMHGRAAPANELVCRLVHAAERGGDRHIGGDAFVQLLSRAVACASIPPTQLSSTISYQEIS